MTWAQLLKALKARQGYTGGDDLASVEAFVVEQKLDLSHNGDVLDLKSLHAKSKTGNRTKLDLSDDEPSDELATIKAQLAELVATKKAETKEAVKAARGSRYHEGPGGMLANDEDGGIAEMVRAGKAFGVVNVQRAIYNRKAKEGRLKTAFATADEAELFGAWAAVTFLPGRASKSMQDLVAKANITTTNTSGGFAVPDIFIPTMIDLKELRGVARQVLDVMPVGSDRVNWPRRTGGVTVTWPGEAVALTESNPAGNNVAVTANKMTALTTVSNELLHDSAIPFGDWVMREMAYGFADKEDEAVFNGDGSSTYGGHTGFRAAIKGLSATIANIAGLHVGTGNAYSELTLTDFEAVCGLLPAYVTEGVWVMHKRFYYNVAARLELAAGGVTATEIREGVRVPKLLGYDVKFSQVMPRTEANSQVCCLLGSFKDAAKAIEVGGATMATDTGGTYFAADVTAFRGTNRFGITVHDVGNASATEGSRVPGPVVGLITAAS